ncbi:unnamed protein product [Callosobruchus maculatus]|uniref:Uncharacterized protein n=1 Tax=Callosobruchus maculatus TaxID=64391 RepID=A0A653BNX8_CALMS|nr:unnamed protein product [Callosobruchus maculatus]
MLRLIWTHYVEKGCCTLNIFNFPGHLSKSRKNSKDLTKQSFSY